MGTALLLTLFGPSVSENSASLWDEGPDPGMPTQSMILLDQLPLRLQSQALPLPPISKSCEKVAGTLGTLGDRDAGQGSGLPVGKAWGRHNTE